MKEFKREIYITFACLDFVTLAIYIIVNFIRHKVPFYSELVAFLEMQQPLGDNYIKIFFFLLMSTFFWLSLFVSMFWFWRQNTKVKWLAMVQIPFRLMCNAPSIPLIIAFISFLLEAVNVFSPLLLSTILIGLFLLMEIAKVVCLFKLK